MVHAATAAVSSAARTSVRVYGSPSGTPAQVPSVDSVNVEMSNDTVRLPSALATPLNRTSGASATGEL